MIDRIVTLFAGEPGSAQSSGGDEATSGTDEAPTTCEESGASAGSDGSRDPSPAIETLLERDAVSKEEVFVRTGLRRDAFLVELVRHFGGEAWQGRLVEETGWPSSTVSRALTRLESNGEIRRYQMGREKVVYLPGQAPESVTVDDATVSQAREISAER